MTVINLPARDFTAAYPCPTYCDLPPGHALDNLGGEGGDFRGHGGPDFGEFLHAGADEFAATPGVVIPHVHLVCDGTDLSPARLRKLAADALAAAEWLEAQQ